MQNYFWIKRNNSQFVDISYDIFANQAIDGDLISQAVNNTFVALSVGGVRALLQLVFRIPRGRATCALPHRRRLPLSESAIFSVLDPIGSAIIDFKDSVSNLINDYQDLASFVANIKQLANSTQNPFLGSLTTIENEQIGSPIIATRSRSLLLIRNPKSVQNQRITPLSIPICPCRQYLTHRSLLPEATM